MRSSKIRCMLVCLLVLVNSGTIMSSHVNLEFLPRLKELCPYTSFCEEDARLILPQNSTERPCCEPCSCEPGCEEYGHCCIDYKGNQTSKVIIQCTSPVISSGVNTIPATHYMMKSSCSDVRYSPLCHVDMTDYHSFSPVSSHSGEVFVNSYCAVCNNVASFVPWSLAIRCPSDKNDHAFDAVKLLQGDKLGETGCHFVYVPPDNINVKPRECVPQTIRECNVSGHMTTRDPLWDYCPMFNATFSEQSVVFFANVFCYICNSHSDRKVPERCPGATDRGAFSNAFTAVLDFNIFNELRHVEVDTNTKECTEAETKIPTLKDACHKKLCANGKMRIGDKCGFFSTEWIGGPFITVLKLTPVGNDRIKRSFITELQPDVRYNLKARWLERNAMRHWNMKTLYKLSSDNTYIDYFIATSMCPNKTVDPSKIESILRQTLTETWILKAADNEVRLRVEFDTHHHWRASHRSVMEKYGFKIDADYEYVFFVERVPFEYYISQYTLPVYYPNPEEIFEPGVGLLNEMFLCNQTELYPHEYKLTASELIIFATNATLYEAQYRETEAGLVSVCTHRLTRNHGLCVAYDSLVIFVTLCGICLTLVFIM